jgi:hypothetical protein
MMWQRVNRDDPEKIFVVAKNSYGTDSLTNGQCVRWDHDTDCDGVGVTVGTEDCGLSAAGVVAESIAAGSYGLIQVYGYHSACRVRSLTSTGHSYHEELIAVAKGTQLAYDITADVFCAEGISPITGFRKIMPFAFALAANASFTTKTIAVFIKALG